MNLPSIKRPMKAPTEAITNEQLEGLKYPLVGSPKLDGFRCVVSDGNPLTSSMKPIENRFIRETLMNEIYWGLDGEIIVGPPNHPDAFHNTSGPLRRRDGEPDFKFYVFDHFGDKDKPYDCRWHYRYVEEVGKIVRLPQTLLNSPQEVIDFENQMLSEGYEGAMIRSLSGVYKEGRTTLREGNIFKRKPFVDTTCIVLGLIEGTTNTNEQKLDERGLSKRSSHKAGKIPNGTLGAFVLASPLWKEPFHCSGTTQEFNAEVWANKEEWVGKLVDIKYQKHGSKDKPRIPGFIKERPIWDCDPELVEALNKLI